MKRTIIAALITLITTATAVAQEPTVTFDNSRVTVSSDSRTIGYDNWPVAAAGPSLLLPTRTFIVRLNGAEQPSDLTWSCAKWREVGSSGGRIDLDDRTTGLDPERHRPMIDPDQPGTAPVYAGPVVEIGNDRYLELSLFPASVSPDKQLRLAESLTISIGSRLLTSADLLNPTAVPYATGRECASTLAATGNVPTFLIVTADTLLESARRLASYKTATGYTAIVKDIDDITSAYTGRDDAEKLREYLKDFYADGGRYVLLLGDETLLPVRYAYHSSTSDTVSREDLQLCDLYFADLTGEWDSDNDNVWGERLGDNADFTPELRVGRLPFSRPEQVDAYTAKLIAYQTDPGDGDRSYLTRAFFFSSDEMRDYGGDGQHARIASVYPASFEIDTTNGVEATSGDDPLPSNAPAPELIGTLSEGYGIVNIIAHGRPDAFGVRTSAYNLWPKSYFYTGDLEDIHGSFDSLARNDRVGFYYSLACDNGGFDEDAPPFVYTNQNIVEQLLGLPGAGAVGFVAYTRWGWTGSSYLQQEAFFESLFAYPNSPAIDAMYAEQAQYYFYRDIVLGQNYFGDPSLHVWTVVPAPLQIALEVAPNSVTAEITSDGAPVDNCTIYVTGPSGRVEEAVTGSDGLAILTYDFALGVTYTVAAVSVGHTLALSTYAPSIVTDVNDGDDPTLPTQYALEQNYPNPFNPSTTIRFALPRASDAALEIFNVRGQRVRTLVDRSLAAGEYEFVWDGCADSGGKAASGVYFYRLIAGEFVETKRMVLLK